MNKKISLLLVGVLLFAGCETNNTNLDEKPNNNDNVIVDDNKENINEKLKEEKEHENYKITIVDFAVEDGKTICEFKIKNILDTTNKGGLADIVFLDSESSGVYQIVTYIPELEVGEEINIKATFGKDLTNASDYYVKMK